MRRIPSHIIDEIMSTARIEEVIGEYVHLKRAGANLKGLSPFTDEKTPSFVVSPAKQIFKCFSTSKGGTVVSFLMEQEQFSYPEALKWLADKYNIELPEEKPLTAEEHAALSERESLGIINDYARDFFVERMHKGEEGKIIGMSYFKERGFREDIIALFELGYCPKNEDSFTETALKKGYQLKFLEQLGLTKTKDDRHFDFFSGRVMFPIHSVSGRVLGFGGRTLLSDKKVAKYFNSPESILYNKSKVLYGIYFAKSEIVKKDRCFLVEGYTDVISLFQSGVKNVVSSSGTSLTKEQIKLIQRYTPNITILYDGDAAGIKASFRGIDLILEEGMNVSVVLFPDGEDPDSYAKNHTSEEVLEYIGSHQKDFVGFKAEVLLKDTENDPLKRAQLIKDIAASIALIPDAIARSVYTQSTSKTLQIGEDVLIQEINKLRRSNTAKSLGVSNNEVSPEPSPSIKKHLDVIKEHKRTGHEQELDLIRILLLYGSRAIEVYEKDKAMEDVALEISVAEIICFELQRDGLQFETPLFQKIYQIILQGVSENILFDPTYFLRMEDQEVVQFVSNYLSPKYELSDAWLSKFRIDTSKEVHRLSQAVKESIYAFKNIKIMLRIIEIQERLNPAHADYNEDNNESLVQELITLQQIKSTFAKALGRIIA
ncbi:MAG: DNA primase [Crocinitomicaceae bacterium]|nr:DNA primase [Crocinitomicaceae bacterium]